jgi:hypothetical protein
MIELIIKFFGIFMPKFIFLGSIFYFIYTTYIFLKCIRRQEKLSESLTKREKQYFYLIITYIFTYILL